jgi:hypothetical protein
MPAGRQGVSCRVQYTTPACTVIYSVHLLFLSCACRCAAVQAAVVLAGLTGVVAGGRAVVSAAANSVKDSAIKLGTLAVFWVAVFLVAQFVLSSP